MQGSHDPALPDDIGWSGDACAWGWKAKYVARRAIAAFDGDEISEARMTFRDRLDRIDPHLRAAELIAKVVFEVPPDLLAHSRWATSPSAPTMRRSPSALTTLMLV